MAGENLLVKEATERLRCTEDKIYSLINSGQLRAVNVAATVGRKPRWVIPVSAIEVFEQARSSKPEAKSVPRRTRRQTKAASYF